MSRIRRQRGSIAIKSSKDAKNTHSHLFELPTQEIALSETFMCHFKDLGLSPAEKQSFSQEYRRELCLYKNIKNKFFIEAYKSLIQELKNHPSQNDPLIIKADSLGSFICLAAIFSGEIPPHSEWRFELEECPLPLFPKELVKVATAAHLFNISFRCSQKSWIKPFPSLRKSPEYMSFKNIQDYEEWRLKVA